MNKALIIVDMQEGFLNERNRWIIPNIQNTIQNGGYALFVEVVFHAERDSLWDKQVHWLFPLKPTVPEVHNLLPSSTVRVIKITKSAFKGDVDLESILRDNAIEEVHIVGIDTEDCVFATAQESFDYGFFTYVLELCTESSESAEMRNHALKILRHLRMVK